MQRRTLKRKIPFPIHLNTSQTALAQQPSLINKREMGKGWGGPGRGGGGRLYSLPCSLFIFFIFIRRF